MVFVVNLSLDSVIKGKETKETVLTIKKGDLIMQGFIGLIMWIYGIISQIMTFVFFVQFCRTDSFLEILFIDTWLSELKGLFWIFLIW